MKNAIEIVGARTNNLQSVDVSLPLHKATMVVGVSGSGKSSLLADTLATEVNGRMRRFLGVHQSHLGDQDVPAFIGQVPACIHFSQGAFRASRRTTVATSSGLLALLRVYFRRYAKPWTEEVKSFVPPPSASNYEGWIQNHYEGPVSVWIVMARWERTDGVRIVNILLRHGIKQIRVRSETDTGTRRDTGREIDLEKFRPLSANTKHLIEAEIGQTEAPSKSGALLALLQSAFQMKGDVIVEFQKRNSLPDELSDERGTLLDSTQHWVHPKVFLPFAPPSEALLSFNSPSNPRGGACRSCQGLGQVRTVMLNTFVAHPERSLHKGALSLWTEKNYRYVNIQHETIEGLRDLRGFAPDKPWKSLSKDARDLILFGSGKEAIPDIDLKSGRKASLPRPFPGFIPTILRRSEGNGAGARALGELISEGPCADCEGTRWSREARALRLGKWNPPSLLALTFDELKQEAEPKGSIPKGLPDEARFLAKGLHGSAEAFISAGLGHLSGERGMTTLSEGESRRSRLAALLRTRGQGLGLLLDEPARGLHEEDVVRLASALAELKQRHTLVINEHRISLAGVADHVLEIGPGAGSQGGRIVNSGAPQQVFTKDWYPANKRSQIPVSTNGPWLAVKGAQLHTLIDIDCRIPLGRLTCVTGVSGSGKSTFIRGILLPALAQALPKQVEADGFTWSGGVWKGITGTGKIDSVLALEPRSPGAQRRSTVATLIGLAEDVRRLFAAAPDARKAGLTATDFGWNAGHGRCQTCLGLGEVEDGETWVSCPHCGGRRFGEEALGVRVEGLSVADLLDLSITDLQNHPFSDLAKWTPLIEQVVALDLGYLTLGRRIDRLSGGEHQRLRVARTLGTERPDGLFLVLDEPSAGLHPHDVGRLLSVLDRVVGEGRNTVVLVEHNLSLIRASDWVIDFGPGGGPDGGKIVGQGPPLKIARLNTPTGRVLRSKKFRVQKPAVRSKGLSARANPDHAKASAEDSALSGRQWLRRLLGEERSGEDLDPVDFENLAVMFDQKATARPYEIGGLDTEIARVLLDHPDDFSKHPERLAQHWGDAPEGQLQIHPLVEEMRVWGNKIPTSVLSEAKQRLKHMGLDSDLEISSPSKLASVRATGRRFEPPSGTFDERLRSVRDAIGIGGGYVELAKANGEILETLEMRRVDFREPAIAPLSPSSATLSRLHSAGSCPCCNGRCVVAAFDESLVIAHSNASPTSERFFRPEVLNILRGVRKSILLPFLKRMTAEGLWSDKTSFDSLNKEQRTILLHGYWRRPGPGSFLKTSKVDPEEVNSWLRWNGLFRAVLDEIHRSKDTDWVSQINAASRAIQCPVCNGTGLHIQSRAITLGPRSFFDWVLEGTVGELAKALREMTPASSRSKNTRTRVLHCLEPLVKAIPRAPLHEEIDDPKLLRAVFQLTAHSMTNLKVLG
jgi:excinuclease ABC A subunit